MGGVFSGGGGGYSNPVAEAASKVAEAGKTKATEPAPTQATSEETKVAANTRARRRMGTRLLFSQERSAGLGTNQTTLGGGAGPGQNTLA
jgi:hypothetical protein